jgi:hypothetical protein
MLDIMSTPTSDNDLWAKEELKLIIARLRYGDSLVGIQELAEFASLQVEQLDLDRSVLIRIIEPEADNLTPEQRRAAMASVGEFLHSVASTAKSFGESGYVQSTDSQGKVTRKLTAEAEAALTDLVENFHKSFPEDVPREVIDKIVLAEPTRAKTDLLLSSLLIAAVSDFEVLFAAIARFFYRIRPDALRASDQKIAWQEIESYASMDEVRARFVEERVNRLMWEGFEDWMKMAFCTAEGDL